EPGGRRHATSVIAPADDAPDRPSFAAPARQLSYQHLQPQWTHTKGFFVMTMIKHPHCAATARPDSGVPADRFQVGAAPTIRRAWHAAFRVIRRELQVRRAMAELRGAGEHMLRDIGLTRGDIECVACYGRF